MLDLMAQLMGNQEENKPLTQRGLNILHMLSKEGNRVAQYTLGVVYDKGFCVDEDKKKAIRLYTLAAEQGQVDAIYNLGHAYRKGDGVFIDYEKAYYWISKAAEKNYPIALRTLGDMFRLGEYVEVDNYEAIKWYFKATGLEDVESRLMILHRDEWEYYRRLEEQGQHYNLLSKWYNDIK